MSKERENIKKRLMRKYRFTIHNENKIDKVMGFNVSPFGVIISLFISFLLVAGTIYLIFAFTPVAEYLPGHVREETRERLVNYALSIDSLKNEVHKQERYIGNIKAILEGDIEYPDTTMVSDSLPSEKEYPIDTTPLEQGFANDFEEKEKYNLISQAGSVGALQGINFYRPLQGMVVKQFNPKSEHFGIDIAGNPEEGVVAIWDGTVIMSDYTANDGYMLMLQHNEDLISVYRNCLRLTKKVGDRVNAGEVIAVSGSRTEENINNDKTENIKPYLHLELWHRGSPLDPSIYIAF